MNLTALKVSPEMLRLIAEIDEFKGSWRMMTTLAPERLAVLKRSNDCDVCQRADFRVSSDERQL